MRFLTREIRVDRQAARHDETFTIPKTANSVRTIPVDSSVLEEIAATGRRDGYVLGRYVPSQALELAFRKTRERAGLDFR